MKRPLQAARRLRARTRRLVADRLDRRLGGPPPVPDVEPEYRILFVCYGNVCRSPLAEGVLRSRLAASGLLGRVQVASAGTHASVLAHPPDPRARRVARRNGISIADLRARRLAVEDLDRFDRILVFDRHNLDDVLALAGSEAVRAKVDLIDAPNEVADPVYGPFAEFERVFERVDGVAGRLVEDARARLAAPPVCASS